MKRLEDYENYEFESSIYRTPEYIEFERSALKTQHIITSTSRDFVQYL